MIPVTGRLPADVQAVVYCFSVHTAPQPHRPHTSTCFPPPEAGVLPLTPQIWSRSSWFVAGGIARSPAAPVSHRQPPASLTCRLASAAPVSPATARRPALICGTTRRAATRRPAPPLFCIIPHAYRMKRAGLHTLFCPRPLNPRSIHLFLPLLYEARLCLPC